MLSKTKSRFVSGKKTLLLILVQILFCTLIYAGGIVPPRQEPDNPEWVKGEILVKFKDDVKIQISTKRGIIETGIKSLNELTSKWQVSEMEKVFKTEEKRTETKTIKTYKSEVIEVPQLFNIYTVDINCDGEVTNAYYTECFNAFIDSASFSIPEQTKNSTRNQNKFIKYVLHNDYKILKNERK